MPYLGNTPASRFTSMDKQTITGDGGTDYTLDHAVGSEQEIEVFVNNVRQEPSVAYTVAGTALTMTGNVASTDDFYVVFQGKAQQSVTHPSNSALAATTGTFSGALSATTGTFSGAVTATSFSGDGSALTGISSNAGSEYFLTKLTTTSSNIATGTYSVVDFGGGGTVVYDTASNVDTANDAYEFDSSSGLYLITFSIGVFSNTAKQLITSVAYLDFSTDDFSTSTLGLGSAMHSRDGAGDEIHSTILNQTQLYKVTSAGTKVRVKVAAAAAGATTGYRIAKDLTDMDVSVFTGDNPNVTYLQVVRIA